MDRYFAAGEGLNSCGICRHHASQILPQTNSPHPVEQHDQRGDAQRSEQRSDAQRFGQELRLTEEERARGVITASAGNHAQAVAYHASQRGIRAQICMPEYTPLVKVTATRAWGADMHRNADSARLALRS